MILRNKFSAITIILLLFGISALFAADDSLKIQSPNYFNEQNNIYEDIHYLEKELLSLSFCSDEDTKDLTITLTCPNEEDNVELMLYTDYSNAGCFYSNYNLNKSPCEDFEIIANFKENNKEKTLKRTFVRQKQSLLINHVLGEDIDDLTDEELSYYLIVQNDIENVQNKISEEIYENLKNSRSNSNKCWPSSRCSYETTSTILRNLFIAGYPLESRLLEDGKNYLEKGMVNNENNPLKFEIELNHDFDDEEIECDLTIDGNDDDKEDYTFDEDSREIDEEASTSITFECNQTIDEIEFRLFNLDDNIQKVEEYDDSTSFTYNIDSFSCIGNNEECDYDASINTLVTYQSRIEDSSLIQNYIDSNIIDDDDEKYAYFNERIEDTGKYLYIQRDDELVDFLKFNQNNDGSWGSNSKYNRIKRTSWAVLGLQKTISGSEYVDDGKKWIYYNEPANGWNNIEENTLAYLSIKEQIKPYIMITDNNIIKNTTNFVIENPTIYKLRNINVKIDDNLEEYVSFVEDIGDLEGKDSLNFTIMLNDNVFGKYTGTLTITGITGKGSEITLLEMPISIEGPPAFSINKQSFQLTQGFTDISLEIKNNKKTFSTTCKYTDPFTNTLKTITINEKTKNLQLKNDALKEGTFNMTLACSDKTSSYEIPIEISVDIAEKAFDLNDDFATITSTKGFSLNLTSLLTEPQTIIMKVEGEAMLYVNTVENSKIIAAQDSRELYFNISNIEELQTLLTPFFDNETNTTEINAPEGKIIIESSNGYRKELPILFDLKGEEKSNSGIVLFASIGLVAVIIIFIAFARYIRNRNQEAEATQNQNQNQNEEEFVFDDEF